MSGDHRETPEEQLTVIARPDAGVRAIGGEVTATTGDVGPLVSMLRQFGATIDTLFGVGEERLRRRAAQLSPSGIPVPDLSRFYRVRTTGGLEELADRLRELELVEAAYVAPTPEPAGRHDETAPSTAEPPSATPNFTDMQGHLRPAPGGVDAAYAWTFPGGEGDGVNIIDVAGGCNFAHEDLRRAGGVIGGQQRTEWLNRGTALGGVMCAERNAFGVTGICPRARARAVSIFGPGSSAPIAIRLAADTSDVGDIVVVGLGARHPTTGSLVPVEWWPEYLDAIRYATSLGVIVLAAAGDGGVDLDDPRYADPAPGFPADWHNPFHREAADSGSILVGAGASPYGIFADRSRLDSSNYGSAVDAQGWGERITTCGYGDLQGGTNPDLWYTTNFGGTTGAVAVVAGAVACLQGIARARGWRPITPTAARRALRGGGTPQQEGTGRPATERIGNRPDLRDMVGRLARTSVKVAADKPAEARIKGKEKEREKPKDKEEKGQLKDMLDKPKEWKENKDKEKEKDKDILDKQKEVKEEKEKERVKELKEKEKEGKEKESEGPDGPQPQFGSPLEERVSRVENAMERLLHFIDPEDRPDLSRSSLTGEADIDPDEWEALRREQEAAERYAKYVKDTADIGKLRDA